MNVASQQLRRTTQATLKSAATRAVYEKYREKRSEERHLFRRKKHEFVKVECEAIEMHGSRNDARKFFQKIKRMSEGFKSKASFCKDQDGNMVTDIKSSLELWRAHFNATLNDGGTNNHANETIRPSRPNTLDNTVQLDHQTGKKWPWPFSGLNSTKASLLNFLKQEEMS